MTNKQLHIGIDLALKILNPTLLSRFLPQEKDYIINKTINDLIHKTAEDARHSIMNNESYNEIVNFYNILEPYLITLELQLYSKIHNHNDYLLPKYADVITNNKRAIICNVDYKVEKVGSLNIDLSTLNTTATNYIPDTNYVEGDIFTFPSIDQVFVSIADTWVMPIYKGMIYKIIRRDWLDLIPFGAPNNSVGTIFTATATSEIVHLYNVQGEALLQVIGFIPELGTGLELVAIKSLNLFEYIAVQTLLITNTILTQANKIPIEKGKYYRVKGSGRFVDITTFGSEYQTVEDGYIFFATNSGIPTWYGDDDSGTIIYDGVNLELLNDATCRLVKPNDVNNFLTHPYADTTTSPLATLNNGLVSIFHNNKYDIARVTLTYVRPPILIDSELDVETDINSNLHSTLVTLAVQDIVSTNNPQLYPTVNAEKQQKQY